METELKIALGKLFGEAYRIQKEQGICKVDDSRIFGLLNGFEEAIESELSGDLISKDEVEVVASALAPYWNGERDIEEMPNFLTFRMDLERKGIRHSRLIDILKYLKANNRFGREIDKLGSYNLSDYDL